MPEPGGILGEIIARKRRDVAARLGHGPAPSAEPTARSLRAALAKPGARFVMEMKRGSPSAGTIAAGVDPARIATAYRGVADAMSVLTDTPYFQGSLDDLAAVRAMFDGPILAKDFLVDPRQIAEARSFGADAVLVMLSVLDDRDARVMLDTAATFGMDALVEVHDEDEMRRAAALGATLIGINNRDLKTLNVDLAVTERLAALAPAGATLVAESGIANHADVRRLAPLVDAFLVGSSLMRADSPARAARQLAYGAVKICGLTDTADIAAAASAGAIYAGLIFVPDTPRFIDKEDRARLAAAARDAGMAPVGVFRDADQVSVAREAERLDLAAVQLHGAEDARYIADLRQFLPDHVEIWPVAAVADTLPEPRSGGSRILFDTSHAGRSGGTGIAFDWSLLGAYDELPRAMLAGGINPDNAATAAAVGAYGLDIGSGVEASPGRKDAAKLTALFDALRPRSRAETQAC